ncbi:hypothetical protein BDV26DRAFT_286742 [Aspergillus bertholletiae]|uniref:Uncharacterized protein n=1 Tax=Aspergillus bertholletiae TaxID=1226010 RepID=A0A5N7ARW0_9EURO|nr:hypothetical protein BDV26DRAFT_286742 [Aspergillus bertholletiae]
MEPSHPSHGKPFEVAQRLGAEGDNAPSIPKTNPRMRLRGSMSDLYRKQGKQGRDKWKKTKSPHKQKEKAKEAKGKNNDARMGGNGPWDMDTGEERGSERQE